MSEEALREQHLKVQFELSKGEIGAQVAWAMSNLPQFGTVRAIFFGAGAGVVSVFIGAVVYGRPFFLTPITVGTLALFVVLGCVRSKRILRLLFRLLPSATVKDHSGRRSVTLTSQGVLCERPAAQVFHRWDAITALTEDRDAFYLHTAGNSFVGVPKKAFQNPADRSTFRTIVRERIPAKLRAQVGETIKKSG
jgi:hypothetical protein